MAEVLAEGEPTGPPQRGSGKKGQYVYWIVFSHPEPETVERLGLKVPTDFTRKTFSQLIVKAHCDCNVQIEETVCFQEPHSNGLIHHNCLVRATKQYRWAAPAKRLRDEYKVCVNFGSNIKAWAAGVIYGRVASDHKRPEELDQSPLQWARGGNPANLEEFVPRPWQAPGFQRKAKLTHLSFLDLCREHGVSSEGAAWVLAGKLESEGDRGLQAYLLENDPAAAIAKVRSAMAAMEAGRRAQLTRMDILRETVEKTSCTCSPPGECFKLMKQVLANNNLEGKFQKEVVATLVAGRKKMRNLCLVGGPNTAKSFLFKPLSLIFKTYSRPDGGSYQLEELLGKELVFLNDFEYDEDAKKWCPWGYFKRFLEGEALTVACPKNRGGNQNFISDAPVFITAPQEVALYRGKKRDEYETGQMDARIKYAYLTHMIPEAQRSDTDSCAHCGARLYLEGDGQPQVVQVPAQSSSSSSSGSKRGFELVSAMDAVTPPQPVQSKTGLEIVEALKEVVSLKQAGIIDSPEARSIKRKILAGE